jgi:hypothetical protein
MKVTKIAILAASITVSVTIAQADLFGLFAGPASAAEEVDKPTVVPVKKAPFHLFTFEDENMALENVTLPPGKSTRYHSHQQDLLFVITAGARITNQVLGKEPVELEFKLGEVRFSGYTKPPGSIRSPISRTTRRCSCWRLRSSIPNPAVTPHQVGPQNMRSLSTTSVFARGGSSSILARALPQSGRPLRAQDLWSPEAP